MILQKDAFSSVHNSLQQKYTHHTPQTNYQPNSPFYPFYLLQKQKHKLLVRLGGGDSGGPLSV